MYFYAARHQHQGKAYAFGNGADLSFHAHVHNGYELVLVTEGELSARVGETTYRVRKNEILLIFPYQLHEFWTETNCYYYCCGFIGNTVEYYHQKRHGTLPAHNVLPLPEEYCRAFIHLETCHDPCHVRGTLYNICGLFDTQVEYRSFGSHNNRQLLMTALEYIEEHYADPCTLRELAKSCSYDYAYLSQHFTKQIGMSFKECVNRRRVEEACYLLKNSEMSILSISGACGFGSLRSFNRNFQQLCGRSPKEYRMQ